jgi:hypothetical protein
LASGLSFSLPVLANRSRILLRIVAWMVSSVHAVAAARHTLVVNSAIKIHERYLFAVGPLFLVILFGTPTRPSAPATAAVLAVIALTLGPLRGTALTGRVSTDCPSLTAAWMTREAVGGLPALLHMLTLAGAASLAARIWRGPFVRAAWLAPPLLVLNGAWYAAQYQQVHYVAATSQLIDALRERMRPGKRLVVVVANQDLAVARTTQYLKFWFDRRVTAYWTGDGPRPWSRKRQARSRTPGRSPAERTSLPVATARPNARRRDLSPR